MADISALIGRFFVDAADLHIPGESVPHTSAGNLVTFLIDGANYFHALRAEVVTLKAPGTGKFFYFTDWLLQLVDYAGGSAAAGSGVTAWTATVDPENAFKLDDKTGPAFPSFIDELAQMASSGTDVRGLIWVSPFVVAYEEAAQKSGVYNVNASSLLSVDALRARPGMGTKVCLNTLAHPLGAFHVKMVVCGDATSARGYVAGIDFAPSRLDTEDHPNAATFAWHDAGARVEGPAVEGLYGYFQKLWNEQLTRGVDRFRIGDKKIPTYVEDTPRVPDKPAASFGPVVGATMHVQVLRTAPQMHFKSGESSTVPIGCLKRLITGFKRPGLSFAPDGIFEFRAALHKAISNAEDYIYVEDQGFYGQEIMDWISDRLKQRPRLKAIFVHHADPADGPGVLRNTNPAINNHLVIGIADPLRRIAFYERTDRTVVHSKTWIIDDALAIIGSANCFRRSLYTDGEASVGVLDEDQTPNNFVVRYRKNLWGEHCGLLTDPGRDLLIDIKAAIRIWDPSWRFDATPLVTPPVAKLIGTFQRKNVPFVPGPEPENWPSVDMSLTSIQYDQADADSRQEF